MGKFTWADTRIKNTYHMGIHKQNKRNRDLNITWIDIESNWFVTVYLMTRHETLHGQRTVKFGSVK